MKHLKFLPLLLAWGLFAGALPAQETPAESTDSPPQAAPAQMPDSEPKADEMRVLASDEDDSSRPAVTIKASTSSEEHGITVSVGSDNNGEDVVNIHADSIVPAGQTAGDVVAVIGNVRAEGNVDGSAVAVLGDAYIANGAEEVVAVVGDVEVHGTVRGDVVAVLGDIKLADGATVEGQVTSIGGRVIRGADTVIDGGVQQVGIIPFLPATPSLRAWLIEGPLNGRWLSGSAAANWSFVVALVCFGFYVFLSLIFGRGVKACAEKLESNPGYVFLSALLALIITPVAMIILTITAVGPVIWVLLMLGATFFGKAAFLAWVGRRVLNPIKVDSVVGATVIGGLIMLPLYWCPAIGILIWSLATFLGLGMAIYALLQSMKRKSPPAAKTTPVASATAPVSEAAANVSPPVILEAVAVAPETSSPMPDAAATTSTASTANAEVPPQLPTPGPETWERAGFGVRLLAAGVDMIVILILGNVVHLMGIYMLLLAAYSIVFWGTRGTTPGGVIFNLKVIRTDGRKLDWTVAIVRGLAAFLSIFAAGIGFLWVAFDSEKQSWHDRIAGTVIVRSPKNLSLFN